MFSDNVFKEQGGQELNVQMDGEDLKVVEEVRDL